MDTYKNQAFWWSTFDSATCIKVGKFGMADIADELPNWARLFKRGLNLNPGLKVLNSGLKFNLGLVLLFEGRLTLTSG